MPRENKERWLTLSEVAQQLGVHEGTIRRWTDAGRLPSFRTPGGHRRFRQEDVLRFIAQQQSSSDYDWKKVEDDVLSEAQKEIAVNLHHQPWHAFYQNRRALEERRAIGQKLLGMLVHYTARGDHRERYLVEAKRVMQDFGREALALGMSLHDAAQAYLFFRRSLANAVARSQKSDDPDSTVLIERMHEFLDEMLLSIIEGYTTNSSYLPSPNGKNG